MNKRNKVKCVNSNIKTIFYVLRCSLNKKYKGYYKTVCDEQ